LEEAAQTRVGSFREKSALSEERRAVRGKGESRRRIKILTEASKQNQLTSREKNDGARRSQRLTP